jgi:hypothetical protein
LPYRYTGHYLLKRHVHGQSDAGIHVKTLSSKLATGC